MEMKENLMKSFPDVMEMKENLMKSFPDVTEMKENLLKSLPDVMEMKENPFEIISRCYGNERFASFTNTHTVSAHQLVVFEIGAVHFVLFVLS
jgi:hypothetical protein